MCNMSDVNDSDFSDEGDISWLTQTPSQVDKVPVDAINDDEVDIIGVVPSFECNQNVHVDRCDGAMAGPLNEIFINQFNSPARRNPQVLYDNIVIEDISTDEDVDSL